MGPVVVVDLGASLCVTYICSCIGTRIVFLDSFRNFHWYVYSVTLDRVSRVCADC
jgi:hypothetical protein